MWEKSLEPLILNGSTRSIFLKSWYLSTIVLSIFLCFWNLVSCSLFIIWSYKAFKRPVSGLGCNSIRSTIMIHLNIFVSPIVPLERKPISFSVHPVRLEYKCFITWYSPNEDGSLCGTKASCELPALCCETSEPRYDAALYVLYFIKQVNTNVCQVCETDRQASHSQD